MNVLWLLLLGFLPAQYVSQINVTPLSFDASELQEDFNDADDQVRLIAVFSPT